MCTVRIATYFATTYYHGQIIQHTHYIDLMILYINIKKMFKNFLYEFTIAVYELLLFIN